MSSTTGFDAWLGSAWDDHAADSAGVAARIAADGAALVTDDAQLVALARLAHHVFGEHLGSWTDGRAQLAALAGHRAAGASARAELPLLDASLALAGGLDDCRATLGGSARIRATALAAGSLLGHDAARAGGLLREAIAAAGAASLADDDPACRTLAVTGNNLACELEDKPRRSDDERELMILAAETARRFWERAGTWLETERAEYRLARTWLAAGEAAQARQHAEACLAIVQRHGGPPLETFFGWEALGLAAAAAGDAMGHAEARQQASAAFARLGDADRGWCQASLDRLEAALAER